MPYDYDNVSIWIDHVETKRNRASRRLRAEMDRRERAEARAARSSFTTSES